MLHRYRLLFGRTCSFNLEHPEVTNWLFWMGTSLAQDVRCGGVHVVHHTEHRIHCGRNEIVKTALEGDFDYLCFIDGDMHPDFRYLHPNTPAEHQPAAREWAKPFLESSLKFMMHERCGVIGSPAVTGPPAHKINVFLAREDGKVPVSRMTHEEYQNTPPSMLQVAAIGTGLMLIDMQVFKEMAKPWFEDAYDGHEDQFAPRLSQDCAFCLKCNDLGFPVYANLYAPSGHLKYSRCEPPEPQVFGKVA